MTAASFYPSTSDIVSTAARSGHLTGSNGIERCRHKRELSMARSNHNATGFSPGYDRSPSTIALDQWRVWPAHLTVACRQRCSVCDSVFPTTAGRVSRFIFSPPGNGPSIERIGTVVDVRLKNCHRKSSGTNPTLAKSDEQQEERIGTRCCASTVQNCFSQNGTVNVLDIGRILVSVFRKRKLSLMIVVNSASGNRLIARPPIERA